MKSPEARGMLLSLARFHGIGPEVEALISDLPDPEPEEFGTLLREARARQGLPLHEAARRSGISRSNLRLYETNLPRPKPGMSTIQALSYGYRIPFSRLLLSCIFTFDYMDDRYLTRRTRCATA